MGRSRLAAWLCVLCSCGSALPGGSGPSAARLTGPVSQRQSGLGIGSSADDLRTGWYPSQPALSPARVSAPDFGLLSGWPVSLDGQIYAQPLLANGALLVVTETNHVYTLDPVTGAILFQRTLENAWAAAELGCEDLAPSVGITGTPVIDTRDPSNVTAYFVTKGYVSGTSGPVGAWMHAVDIPTLTERPSFPVRIQGQADNNGAVNFDGKYELQRPGLLMLGDTVYAAFAGHCDIEPFQGWIAGVSSGGALTAFWTATNELYSGSGIWQSGGAPISDGPDTFIVATGNGPLVTDPTPGKSPPPILGQAWVRLQVQGNGKLQPTDFFTPYDGASLNVWDAESRLRGTGGPARLVRNGEPPAPRGRGGQAGVRVFAQPRRPRRPRAGSVGWRPGGAAHRPLRWRLVPPGGVARQRRMGLLPVGVRRHDVRGLHGRPQRLLVGPGRTGPPHPVQGGNRGGRVRLRVERARGDLERDHGWLGAGLGGVDGGRLRARFRAARV